MDININKNENIGKILKENSAFPLHAFGQNFIISQKIAQRIVNSARLEKDDFVVEIGSGIGGLTKLLLEKKAKVIAIELDAKLTKILKKAFKEYENLKVVEGDVLRVLNNKFTAKLKKYKIAANIPYKITSPLIRKILALENKPELVLLMVQKEVAERIIAKPSSSKRGYLSMLAQLLSKPEILFYLKKENFYNLHAEMCKTIY